MNISGIPLQVTLTGLPAGNTPAEAALENIFICENDITDVLWQRWTACYMLYRSEERRVGKECRL